MEKSTKFTAIVNKNNAIVIPKTARLKTDIRPGSMLDVTVEVVARNEAGEATP
jgi:AbrB family looped-hinge helix DNA binding protein